jgi:hypothetical protein
VPKLRKIDEAWARKKGGWMAYCPGCEEVHVYDERWTFTGTEDKPTFKPSYLTQAPNHGKKNSRRCHSFLTDGVFHFLADCSHDLAGSYQELAEFQWGPPEEEKPETD